MSDLPAADNPFATRRVRPGALRYRFPAGVDLDALIERLRHNGWRGQIVGPHGSGKSTLLAALRASLEATGRPLLAFELHDGQRRLPATLPRRTARGTLVTVDGYEQLGFWGRLGLKRLCRRADLGLLVTAHRDVGLPQIFQTWTDARLAEQLAGILLAGYDSDISSADVRRALAAQDGNLRETLFALYDLYEWRRS